MARVAGRGVKWSGRRRLLETPAMPDSPSSHYSSSAYGAPPGPPTGGSSISNTAVRVVCGLTAPLAFVCAGICFYFLIKPFGENPPPKEVALGVGIAFALGGLFMTGMALFYRGSIPTPGLDEMRRAAQAAPQRWTPANVPPGAVADPRSLLYARKQQEQQRRGRRGEILGVVALLAILIGPFIGYAAYQRQQVLDRGKAEPQVMKVYDLGRKGPGDNIHVKVTDFEIGGAYAVTTKSGSWQSACLAAFPRGKKSDPKALKVVIRTSSVHNEKEVAEFGKRASVEGVVVNSIYEWEHDKEYMKQAYPGVDTSAIWVVQENYTFPNEREIKIMYGISSGVVGLAVFCGLGAVVRRMS
jgi:hypothetical protein